ncbi:hypothetical protein ACVBEH_10755 [Roseateles sp. GG27B]
MSLNTTWITLGRVPPLELAGEPAADAVMGWAAGTWGDCSLMGQV